MSFSLIAAVGQNNELGKKGDLVFHIPGDLKYFKKVTMGHPVFMGLNTWRSLPGKLPGRDHYVLTYDPADVPEGITPVTDLDAFVTEHEDSDEELFVIGGGMVYKQMLPHCEKLYLTEVHASDPDADTFFPDFDKTKYTRTVVDKGSDNNLDYDFVLYTRKASNA